MTVLPSKAAISQILTGQDADAGPLAANDAAVKAVLDGLIDCLTGGTAGQVLASGGVSSVEWANQ